MAILNNNPLVGASGNQGGYNINNSLRFRQSASAYLNRTPASTTNQKTFTWSGWVKRGALSSDYRTLYMGGNTQTDTTFSINFSPSNEIEIRGYNTIWVLTTQVFRDPSAWYHIVVAVDTTQATAANRIILYVNGNQVTARTYTAPTQNTNFLVNTNVAQAIGYQTAVWGFSYFDGYMAEVNWIDGQALTPSSFGETDTTTGVWKPKAYTGTYGTNGFYLKFSDIATTSGSNAGLGKDFSGNSNYWTTNNISVTSGTTYDAMTDVPTNTSATVANYAVMNPLDKGLVDITGANLNIARTSASASWAHVRGTMQIPSSGKWYAELTFNSGSTDGAILGLCQASFNLAAQYNGSDASNAYVFATNGYTVNNNTATNQSITFSTGDIINMAFDRDTNKVWFGRNNTWLGSGNPSAGTNETMSSLVADLFPLIGIRSTTTASVNFGQRPFTYTPPTGYLALNTFNLPNPTILQGNKYMDATLYTGNGSTQSITNAGAFRPDFVWIKRRDGAGQDHVLQDSNRGFGGTTKLASSSTAAENTTGGATGSEWGSVTAANSNGFSITASTSGDQVNKNTWTYVGWQWQAGQGSTSSNTSGSITSTVSVNATAGFSIVTYTGTGANATVGHGLGVAPKMIIFKNRSSNLNWIVYTSTTGAGNVLFLDATNASTANTTAFNNTAPTSTVFSVGAYNNTNQSTNNMVAYCWAEIAGFSHFGSYTGNSSSDGPFVYTGFRPKFVMVKRSSSTGPWEILDSSRNTFNVTQDGLRANATDAEATGIGPFDFLSNGFKLRGLGGVTNDAGTFIYAAFAENPFKNANAR